MERLVELKADRVRFYSAHDEEAFFEWLKKLPCVVSFEGHGTTIHVAVRHSGLTENCLRELLSMFRRYEVSMSQLLVFGREEFGHWFRDKRAFWHASIFGD